MLKRMPRSSQSAVGDIRLLGVAAAKPRKAAMSTCYDSECGEETQYDTRKGERPIERL